MSDVIIVIPPSNNGDVNVDIPSNNGGDINVGFQGQTDLARLLPLGGTMNQVLAKASSADYNVRWVNQSGGGGGGDQQVFVQDDAPTFTGVGLWVQTGLSPAGAGFTLWFEDGL